MAQLFFLPFSTIDPLTAFIILSPLVKAIESVQLNF